MKPAARRTLVVLWVLSATLILGSYLAAHPEIGPGFPDAFSAWLLRVYGAKNADEVEDLETVLVLGIAFFVVSLVTWAVLRLLRSRSKA